MAVRVRPLLLASRARLVSVRVALAGVVALVGATSAPRPAWMTDPSYGQPVDLSARPSLQAAVTLAQEDLTVRDLLAALEEEHGVRLQGEPAALDKRVAVFATERPLWEVLQALAQALDGRWRLYLNNLWLRLTFPPDDVAAPSAHFGSLLGREPGVEMFPWDPIPDAEESDATGQQRTIRISDPDSPGAAVARGFGTLFESLTPAQQQALASEAGLHDAALTGAQRATLVSALRDMTLAPALREFVNPAISRFSNEPIPDDAEPVRAWWVQRGTPEAMMGPGGGRGTEPVVMVGEARLMGGMSSMNVGAMPRGDVPLGPEEGIYLGARNPDEPGGFGMALQGYLAQKMRERGLSMPTPRRMTPPATTRLTAMAAPAEASEAVAALFKVLAEERELEHEFPSLAALAHAAADALNFPVVVALDGHAGDVALGTPTTVTVREWLRAAERVIPGRWLLEGETVIFRRTLPVEPLDVFAKAFATDYQERVPRAWLQRRRALERELQLRGETQPSMLGWQILRRLLTDRQWDTLRSDVILWEDLSSEQQSAYTAAEWDWFVWNRTKATPAPIQALLRGDPNAGLPLDASITLWVRDEEDSLALHIGLADGQTLTYRVPPGVERRLRDSSG